MSVLALHKWNFHMDFRFHLKSNILVIDNTRLGILNLGFKQKKNMISMSKTRLTFKNKQFSLSSFTMGEIHKYTTVNWIFY
jgi:hypothetical protein